MLNLATSFSFNLVGKWVWHSGRKKMGKKLRKARQMTGDDGAGGVASRTRSGGRRAEARPKEKERPPRTKSDPELGFPICCQAKQFDENVCLLCLNPLFVSSLRGHIISESDFCYCLGFILGCPLCCEECSCLLIVDTKRPIIFLWISRKRPNYLVA